MNLILLQESDRVAEGRYELRGARAAHIVEVLRQQVGGSVRVGILDGPVGTGHITAIGGGRVELAFGEPCPPPPRPLVDLLLAIPRPKSLRKLLPEVAALGVDRIVLLRTWRVAKPYVTADVLEPAQYRPLLHEGLMQARRTIEPHVLVEPLFKPFVEDRAPALCSEAAVRLVAHPSADRPMSSIRVRPQDRVVVAVGPEGGFIPYEVDALASIGFTPVSMGPHPLRVETACVSLLAQVALLRDLACRRKDA